LKYRIQPLSKHFSKNIRQLVISEIKIRLIVAVVGSFCYWIFANAKQTFAGSKSTALCSARPRGSATASFRIHMCVKPTLTGPVAHRATSFSDFAERVVAGQVPAHLLVADKSSRHRNPMQPVI
jgi:hypothetical protein